MTTTTNNRKAKTPSALDAAYQVLKSKDGPMSCRALLSEMLTKGLWTTGGHTPEITIRAAMTREIKTNPGTSRFVKTRRGYFAAVKA